MAIKFLRAKGGIRQTHLTPKSLSCYLVLIILQVKRNGEDEILRTVNIFQNVRHFRGLSGSLHGCQARVEEVLTTTDQPWEGNAPEALLCSPTERLCLMQPVLPIPWVLPLFFSRWAP